MILVIATIFFLPSISMATEFVVGDHHGWATGFNYSAWAEGKVFHVGDTLVFRYGKGQHNVYKVNETEFQSCTVPQNSSEALSSGSDTILLALPGKKWYLCGVGEHCSTGQKLAITVLPKPATIASPSQQPGPPMSPIAEAPGSEQLVPSPVPDEPEPVQHDVPHFGRFVPYKMLLRGIFH